MSIIIFILVLGLLIFIHELGHFLVAKKSGIRVDEFAIGFPPRIFSFVKGGTRYALNLIPFGGYVKIFGESPEDGADDKNAKDSMINKPKYVQALVLVAGVVFNLLLAFVIFWILFMKGSYFSSQILPFAQYPDSVRVDFVMENSIASNAGLKEGDVVLEVQTQADGTQSSAPIITEILYRETKEITNIKISRNNEVQNLVLTPSNDDVEQKFGFALTSAEYVKSNPIVAGYQSYLMTGHLTKLTTFGLLEFFGKLFTGRANFEQVAGPVGLVGLVDKAAENGIGDILFLTAIISINLAVLNLLPFPALDGGRLAVIGIESIIRRDLDYKKVAVVNVIGFFLLIALMILLTFHDIKNLFN
jgi:regulator of sigma E protease